jgi:CRISPR system Cascade subunit CasB
VGKAPGEAAETFPHVVPRLPRAVSPADEWAYYLVAGLFAWHPQRWLGEEAGSRPSLGASLARLRRQTQSDSAERTTVALLNSHRDDLAERLRRAVALLRSHDVPVDWAQLLRDLLRWHLPSREVQRRWARDFWGTPSPEDEQRQAPAGANAASLAVSNSAV